MAKVWLFYMATCKSNRSILNYYMQGLITKDRKGIDPAAAPFARGYGPEEVEGLKEGASLLEVVSIHWNSSCRLD